jgi:hypothetical protein
MVRGRETAVGDRGYTRRRLIDRIFDLFMSIQEFRDIRARRE